MTKRIIALTSIVLSLTFVTVFVSCNDDDNNSSNDGTPQTSGNVYIAGSNGESAVLWSNGQGTIFPYETAYGVAVSGNEVYVIGSRDNQYCYWKAGQPETPIILEEHSSGPSLPPTLALPFMGNTFPTPLYGNAIAISGSDVYAGNTSTSSGYYWKNGQRVSLPDEGYTTGITVSGNDVYMAGYTGTDGAYDAVYWKNGQKVVLANNASSTGIVVSGNDVYVCGFTITGGSRANAVYWKNGQQITLSAQDVPEQSAYASAGSYATGIAVHGNDVYVCGNFVPTSNLWPSAVYWKNGQQIILAAVDDSSGMMGAMTRGIAVSGNDVYVCGTTYSSGTSTAVYWKNGHKVELGTGVANAITIQ